MLQRLEWMAVLMAAALVAQTAPAEPPCEVRSYRLAADKLRNVAEYNRARYSLYFIDEAHGLVLLTGVQVLRVSP